MLVSGIQQIDLVIHMHFFLFQIFFNYGYYKILRSVPCAIQ